MKKILAITLLSLATLHWTTGQAAAWFFPICGHCKCCKTVCLRQYNAFSAYCLEDGTVIPPSGSCPAAPPAMAAPIYGPAAGYYDQTGPGEVIMDGAPA